MHRLNTKHFITSLDLISLTIFSCYLGYPILLHTCPRYDCIATHLVRKKILIKVIKEKKNAGYVNIRKLSALNTYSS